jgi:hypothetical protein
MLGRSTFNRGAVFAAIFWKIVGINHSYESKLVILVKFKVFQGKQKFDKLFSSLVHFKDKK